MMVMLRIDRLVSSGLLGAVVWSAAGCQMFHELQPHRLRRWNQGPGMSSEAYFSVPDVVAVEAHPLAADASRRNDPLPLPGP
jgi:hypothetical protein